MRRSETRARSFTDSSAMYEIPATSSSNTASRAVFTWFAAHSHTYVRQSRHYRGMTLVVTDEPPDRPEWVTETIRLLAEAMERRRADVLARVAPASDSQ